VSVRTRKKRAQLRKCIRTVEDARRSVGRGPWIRIWELPGQSHRSNTVRRGFVLLRASDAPGRASEKQRLGRALSRVFPFPPPPLARASPITLLTRPPSIAVA
jgi:hypothetical protein